MKQYPANGGFTLIELLITLVIAAVLMTVAVPNFIAFQRNSELTSIANSFMAATNGARGEAMKRGRYTMVVPSDGTNWSSGWIVFVDVDRTQTYGGAGSADITVSRTEPTPAYVTVAGNNSASAIAPYIMFDASGYPKNKAGLFADSTFEARRNDVSGSELLKQTRRVKILRTGQVRVCTPVSLTDTNCSPLSVSSAL